MSLIGGLGGEMSQRNASLSLTELQRWTELMKIQLSLSAGQWAWVENFDSFTSDSSLSMVMRR